MEKDKSKTFCKAVVAAEEQKLCCLCYLLCLVYMDVFASVYKQDYLQQG